MLEMESGELSVNSLDGSDQNLSFYSPEQSLQLRYKLPPAADDSLPTKQLCTQSLRFPRDLLPEDGFGAICSRDMERIPVRDEREKPLGSAEAQSYNSQRHMSEFGLSLPSIKQLCATQAAPFAFSSDLLENVGKVSPREQPSKTAAETSSDCAGDAAESAEPRKSDTGRPGETSDTLKANANQDQDIISVIASSLSHLNLMQQSSASNGIAELAGGLKPTAADHTAQRRMVSRQMPDELYMRSNFHQNTAYPAWEYPSEMHWNQQQYVNQLLLSRAGQILPSLNGDLAAAISKLQIPTPRPLQQVINTPKSTSDGWLAEELVNGCNMHNLLQSQQSARFDAQKFPVMNPDFLDILRTPEHLKKDNGLLNGLSLDQIVPNVISPLQSSLPLGLHMDHYSRKVFVGGLPPDIAEEEITQSFRKFGPLVVDWPHKAESKSYFPPKGYCFLLFQDEMSVQALISSCVKDDGKLYWSVSSPTIKDKPVQIRPWNLSDSDFVMDGSQPLDPRKTIFVGGVPRPLRAVELAIVMNRLYGGVCYAGIDTDPELKYPKGAGRVAFSNQQSYIAAISARFVQLQHADIDKRVEVKPYVLDDQLCDECQGARCGGKFAPYFCANVACLQYYCEHCWNQIHTRPGREFHKPLVKEGADRPRTLPFRWC